MYIWNTQSLSSALNSILAKDTQISKDIKTSNIEFNSQNIIGGELFIALTGGVTDGHLYVADALEKGAACAIVSKHVTDVDATKLIMVSDTYEALLSLANYKRQKSTATFIGITGSVGKTSTKNFIAAALKSHGNVFVSRGNFNNHLGVPINLASMADDTEYAVIEMGMNHVSELHELTLMVRPNIAVITNIETTHIGHLGSQEAIAAAKSEIFNAADDKFVAVLNSSSNCYAQLCERLQQLNVKKIFSFAKYQPADAILLDVSYNDQQMQAKYNILGEIVDVSLNIIGEHQAVNLTIALSVLKILKLDIPKSITDISRVRVESGRGLIVNLKIADNCQVKLIDDCYNASPVAIIAALNNLKHIQAKRKIVVLADMKELGEYTRQLHEDLAPFIIENEIDQLITLGEYAKFLHDQIPIYIKSKHFSELSLLKAKVISLLQDGDLILFKGSRATKLYLLVNQLISEYQNDL